MSSHNGGRTAGVRRLIIGIVGLPLMLIVMAVLFIVAIPVWFINNLWQIVFGSPLTSENSRLGYYWYVAQSNIQYIISGRGEFRIIP